MPRIDLSGASILIEGIGGFYDLNTAPKAKTRLARTGFTKMMGGGLREPEQFPFTPLK